MTARSTLVSKSIDQLYAEAMAALHSGRVEKAKAGFQILLKRAPNHLDGHFLLGTLYAESGDIGPALRHLGRATELSPRSARAWNNLATTHRLGGSKVAAMTAYLRALACEPDMAEAGLNLAGLLDADEFMFPSGGSALLFQSLTALGQFHQLRGDHALALDAYRRASTIEPESSDVAFHIAALEGRPLPRRPPGDVRHLFDGYADIFDQHLVDHLGYQVPQRIASLLSVLDGGKPRYRQALDLGCGTGLSGIAVRARTEHLIGVDISPRMLAKALDAGVYDQVIEQDLFEFLAFCDVRFDLIVAADVLIYVGALDDLFAAIRGCACDGALFMMSVELNSGEGDYLVGAEDRYLHSPGYLHRVAASQGWQVLEEQPASLRKSGESKSSGIILALKATTER